MNKISLIINGVLVTVTYDYMKDKRTEDSPPPLEEVDVYTVMCNEDITTLMDIQTLKKIEQEIIKHYNN